MSKREAEELIRLHALDLGVGGADNTMLCPFCPPGKAEKTAFRVARIDTGIVYSCYRAKCPASGFIPTAGFSLKAENGKKKFVPKYLHRPLKSLPTSIRKYLMSKYRIDDDDIARNELKYDYTRNRLYFPILNHMGYVVGDQTKRLPQGFLSKEADRAEYKAAPKSELFWRSEEAPRMHWARGLGNTDYVVLVEDVLSAIRVSKYARCVALLGTIMSNDKVRELSRHTQHIKLMLDADTWDRPGKMALPIKLKRRYGLLFREFDLVRVTKDPKDMDDSELRKILGV